MVKMIEKPIRKVFTMSSYLQNLKDNDIRSDQDVQRAAGQYSANMNNELIFTVLTDDYIPPIIIGEDMNYQKWIIDGLQRSTCFRLFKYANYKITSSIRKPVVPYRKKVVNEDGDITWEYTECNIKGKTYETLPRELQQKFDEYQVETAIHEKCTTERISELVCRYNNHRPMNTSQKAFTYIGRYAKTIRDILDHKFFIECRGYKENEKLKGVMERIVSESVMSIFHLDNWKKGSEAMNRYLNEHSSPSEFLQFNELIERLGNVYIPEFDTIFTSKESFIWFHIFYKFTKYELDDKKFAQFIQIFHSKLHNKKISGITYDELADRKNTKDRSLIIEKLDIIETLMKEYLHVENITEKGETEDIEIENGKTGDGQTDSEEFIVENVGVNREELREDMDFYHQTLDDLLDKVVRDGSKLKERNNRLSLLAMIVYSYDIDVDPDEWLERYAGEHDTYFADQKKNYLYMKKEFNAFRKTKEKTIKKLKPLMLSGLSFT